MQYRTFGQTGIKVSPYALGAMMFGSVGNRSSWASRSWSWLAGGPERSWAAWLPAVVR